MSLGGDGAAPGLDGLEFHHDYTMSASHVEDLRAFYETHPGLMPAHDLSHTKDAHALLHSAHDANMPVPMHLGSEGMHHHPDTAHVGGMLPDALSHTSFDAMLAERSASASASDAAPGAHADASNVNYGHNPEAYAPDMLAGPHTPGHTAFLQANAPPKNDAMSMGYGAFPQAPRAYGSLDTPAITPASVFSTVSSASTNDFLSPLTSPALQPQASSQHMYAMGDPEQLVLQQGMLLSVSSPSQPGVRSPFGGAGGAAYAPRSYEMGAASSDASASASERGSANTARRGRSTTAESRANKVRSSPFMKPTQSPKPGPGPVGTITVWQSNSGLRKRDASNPHASPSLGALESLSNTMQEASGLSMPSPALSPALMAGGAASATSTPRMLPHGGSAPPMGRSRSRLRNQSVDAGTAAHTSRASSVQDTRESGDNSPSPIDLAAQEAQTHSPAKPVTPGTIMGLAHSAPAETSGGAWPAAYGGSAHASPSTGAAPGYSAANAVATTALMNVSQPRTGVFFSGPQPKPILPGGLSSEDRNAWMHLRRAGNGGLDQRRTSHKAAEQKRRDSLKQCFDELRGLLPAIALDESAPFGSVLGPDGSVEDQVADGFDPEALQRAKERDESSPEGSGRPRLYVATPEQAREANATIAKVLLLRHSNEYLVRLKQRITRRDAALRALGEEVVRLQTALAEARGDAKDTSVVSRTFDSLSLAAPSASDDARAAGGAPAAPAPAPAEAPAADERA